MTSAWISTALFPAVALAQGSGPWQHATPEEFGMRTEDFDVAADRIGEEIPVRHCLNVAVGSKMVYERYYRGQANSTYQAWSATKTLSSTLVGMAVQQTSLEVNDTLAQWLDEPSGFPGDGATVENLLTMTGRAPVGSAFHYDAVGVWFFNNLSRVVAAATGRSSADFKDYMFDVLGIEDSRWNTALDMDELINAFSAFFSCRDLLRVGQLWLNKGHWDGHGQVVSEQFIERGTTHVFPDAGPGNGYGYAVWLRKNCGPHYYINGMAAQTVWVVPQCEAVVASMGLTPRSGGEKEIWFIVKDALGECADEVQWEHFNAEGCQEWDTMEGEEQLSEYDGLY